MADFFVSGLQELEIPSVSCVKMNCLSSVAYDDNNNCICLFSAL